MNESKQACYDRYFERNSNNIKNTWKRIKSFLSLKTLASSVPTILSLDSGDTIVNPYNIANNFNHYFTSIAETRKRSIKYSNEYSSTIFLQPTDKEEIANAIFSLNFNKASDPCSLPYRMFFLLKNIISG